MNILRIFGIVAAIHAFALLLIFANPGCSSSVAKSDPVSAAAPPAAPDSSSSPMVSAPLPAGTAPMSINPDAPAAAPAAAAGALYSPTRPGTSAAAALETQPVEDVTPTTTYAVGKGDSLWSIAKKNHLKVSELAAANNLKAGATLRPGQKLLIPDKPPGSKSSEGMPAPAAPAASAHGSAPAKTTGDSFKYTVRQSDTLGGIAHRFGVRTGDLATKNAISDPAKIRPGQELIIPGKSGKSAKSSGAGGSAKTAASAAGSGPSLSPAPMPAAAPTAETTGGPAPAPMPDVPVIKIDSTPSGPADQPKSP